MEWILETHCNNCGRTRDAYSRPPLPQLRGHRSQGSSASFSAARHSKVTASVGRSAGKVDISSAYSTSEGASPKSGSPINIRHDVTPERTSISISKISKHANGPSERELPLEEPIDETQYQKESEKRTITADEIPFREDTYEPWIADDCREGYLWRYKSE